MTDKPYQTAPPKSRWQILIEQHQAQGWTPYWSPLDSREAQNMWCDTCLFAGGHQVISLRRGRETMRIFTCPMCGLETYKE